MASTRNEAPKAPRGWGMGRGASLPTGKGPGRGYVLSSGFKKDFWAQYGNFWCILEANLLQLNCLSYTYKPVSLDFGL